MDDSYRKWCDYNRNQLEQLNKLHDQFRSSGFAVEIQKMQARSAGFVAEIQKMQARSAGFVAAIQKLQDQFRSVGLAPEIQRMQALSTGFVAEIQKMQDQFRSSGFAAEIQRMQARSAGFVAAIRKLQDQFRSSGLAAEIQRMQALSTGFVAAIQKMQDQFRSSGLAAEIQKMQALSTGFAAEIQKMQIASASSVITRLSEMTENLRNVDYVINPDGTITSQNGIFNQSAIQTIIESYLETTHEADNVSFETKIDNILKDVLNHHPVISKIIVHVLLPLFISILVTIYFSPTVQIDYNIIAKQIKKEVRQIEIDSEFYNYYRFVSAPSITVRSKNSTKSKYVGKLYFGYLVRIIHKKKNWSLIEYRDKEGNVIIQGWVFTRYIKRLN